jgi:hypothetical protein
MHTRFEGEVWVIEGMLFNTAQASGLETFACHHKPVRDDGAIASAAVISGWTAIHESELDLCEICDSGACALFSVFELLGESFAENRTF